LSPSSWEQERFRRRKKWQGERRKETFNKDESEKDSDSPESLPDSTETQEVAIARENLVTLMAEQKKIQKQKVMSLVTTRGQTNTSDNSTSPGTIVLSLVHFSIPISFFPSINFLSVFLSFFLLIQVITHNLGIVCSIF